MLKRAVLIVLLLTVLFTLFAEAQQAAENPTGGAVAKASTKKRRAVKKSKRAGKRRSSKKGKRNGKKRRSAKKSRKGKKGGKKRRGSKKSRKGKKGGKKRRGSKKGKKAAKKVRIIRLKDGRIVKRIRRSGAVLQKVCKIVRKVGRKTTVCCKGKAKIIRKKKNVHCRKIRVCKKQVNKCVKKGKKGKPCKRRRIICKKHKVSLRCFIKIPKRKFRWSGPKTCKTGFSLDVKRKGKFRAIRFCKPTPTSAPGKPEGEVRCIASGDPHYTAFDKKYTDFYQTGDFLLAQTEDKLVSVHTRQQLTNTWRTNAVNKAVGVLINGKDKFVYKGETNSYIINGKKVNLAVGQTVNFEDGGSVKRTGNTNFEVKCIHNIRVVGDLGGTIGTDPKANFYINVYVFAPTSVAKKMKGHCGEGANHKRENVSGIFAHVVFPEFLQVKVPKATAAQQKAANKVCAKAKNIHTKHNCVVDFLLGGALAAKANLGVERKAQKIEKAIVKKRKNIIKKVAKKAAKAAKKLARL